MSTLIPLVFSSGWASGVNAYLVVLVLGIADRYGNFADIPDALSRTDVLIGAALLYVMEFVADKIPYIDSAWDAVSTVDPTDRGRSHRESRWATTIRGILGMEVLGLAGLGGGTALASHSVKASSRLAVNSSPEPVTNTLASLGRGRSRRWRHGAAHPSPLDCPGYHRDPVDHRAGTVPGGCWERSDAAGVVGRDARSHKVAAMRVVIIGGGLGGMATAVRLAKIGHAVTLVEAASRMGGAIGTVTKGDFAWDTGPNSTLLPAVLRDLFRKSGRPLERELELVPCTQPDMSSTASQKSWAKSTCPVAAGATRSLP
jgi:hypothetical protein